ncbi:hypothetical protein [Paenibacillus gallinarum]|nr:hypothetical protein [Paenibacillus gallinarum]
MIGFVFKEVHDWREAKHSVQIMLFISLTHKFLPVKLQELTQLPL